VNRLHGGLCVTIDLLGAESCRELIDQFLTTESLLLSSEEIDAILAKAPLSPRELIGLLSQLHRESQLQPGRRAHSRNVKATLDERHGRLEVTLAEIARATAS